MFVYVIRVVDASSSPEVLYAYGYWEDDGAKGGNNLASLLLQSLRDFGFIMDNQTGSRLSIIMDNCSEEQACTSTSIMASRIESKFSFFSFFSCFFVANSFVLLLPSISNR